MTAPFVSSDLGGEACLQGMRVLAAPGGG